MKETKSISEMTEKEILRQQLELLAEQVSKDPSLAIVSTDKILGLAITLKQF